MDFSGILILPFSAVVAFITWVGAAIARRERPRLLWPFTFSSLVAGLAFFSLPAANEVSFWPLTISMMILWSAAVGTVIGALLARAAIAGIGRIRSR